jgi:hypothetical protein
VVFLPPNLVSSSQQADWPLSLQLSANPVFGVPVVLSPSPWYPVSLRQILLLL